MIARLMMFGSVDNGVLEAYFAECGTFIVSGCHKSAIHSEITDMICVYIV